MKKLAPFLFALCSAFLLSACGGSLEFIQQGRELADSMAQRNGWTKFVQPTPNFPIVAYRRITAPGQPLSVYIEGDGAPWANRQQPADPTPLEVDTFKLALADPAPNRLYLSRACQYLSTADLARCDPVYWSTGRLAPAVISALNEVIEREKAAARAPSVLLYGKSGGGVAAALLAARRTDVRFLMTAASYLDVALWTRTLGVTPLRDSLDPTSFAAALAPIPQVHIAGGKDDIVPPAVVESYVRRLGPASAARLVVMPRFDHECSCWIDNWPSFLQSYRPAGGV